jgi:hypothetical protein
VAEVTLDTKLGRLELRPEGSFLSPLLGAALPSIQSRNGENATPILQRNGVLGVGPPGCGGSAGEEHAFEVSLARLNGKFPTAP